MQQTVIRRFVALGFWALTALYTGARLMLDFVGYTTAPEDFETLERKLPGWLEWLFSTPWPVPAILMLVLTAFVVWFSWPRRTVRALTLEQARQEGLPVQPVAIESRFTIRLYYRKGDVTPELINDENLHRYYSLTTGFIALSEKETKKIDGCTILIVVFSMPVSKCNVRVRFASGSPVAYEIKDSTERYAVIVFEKPLGDNTIEVETY